MERREAARARARLHAALRERFAALGYEEVETPCLVPAPGMEPHIQAFEAAFLPEGGGAGQPLYLHTSPEYAMKRLLADGFSRIFQLARVFRNGEVSATHNPEFTMVEFYRAGTDYRGIMADLEELVAHAARAVAGGTRVGGEVQRAVGAGGPPLPGGTLDLSPPFQRLTVAEAFRSLAGVDLAACGDDPERLRAELVRAGLNPGQPDDSFDDLFFRVFLEQVEPRLGVGRPTYLVDWPASMAALARLRADDPRWAERFELYAGGLELANGFSELTDAAEQRRRFEEEKRVRRRFGREPYPVDERFLAALPRMPEAGGVAVGLDRLLMLLVGARSIEEVLLFPAAGFVGG